MQTAHNCPNLDSSKLFTTVNHWLTLVNQGKDIDANFAKLRQAQQQLARALEQAGEVRTTTNPTTGQVLRTAIFIYLDHPRQLGLLNKQDFDNKTVLRIRKYRIMFDGDGLKRRVWVWNPNSDYGLADLPPSRIPQYIREFMQ